MKVELELWQLITLLLTFLGACAGGGKLLLNQIQKSLDSRFASQDQARLANHEQPYRLDAIEQAAREETNQWQRVERELMSLKAEPADPVRPPRGLYPRPERDRGEARRFGREAGKRAAAQSDGSKKCKLTWPRPGAKPCAG